MDTMDSYFLENDADFRLELLERACTEGLPEREYQLRRAIWDRRYGKREGQKQQIDYFIRCYVLLQMNAKKPKSKTEIEKYEEMQKELFHDLYLDDIGTDPADIAVLKDEYAHCARLYIYLCMQKDRRYATKAFGLIRMSEDEIKEKIGDEFDYVLNELAAHSEVKGIEYYIQAFLEEAEKRRIPVVPSPKRKDNSWSLKKVLFGF